MPPKLVGTGLAEAAPHSHHIRWKRLCLAPFQPKHEVVPIGPCERLVSTIAKQHKPT